MSLHLTPWGAHREASEVRAALERARRRVARQNGLALGCASGRHMNTGRCDCREIAVGVRRSGERYRRWEVYVR